MPHAIETGHLRKAYQDVVAVDDLTLEIPQGSMFGLVGRNGAGKTTTLNLLIGLLYPDAGWARIEGHDAHRDGPRARDAIAFVSEEAHVYPWLTVEQAARYWSRLSGRWDEAAFRQCVDWFDLPLKRSVAKLSKGMRTQLLLALAVGKQPNIYILDEPTAGLDPLARRHVLRLLGDEVREKGRTVLLSSHVLSELDDTCTHAAVLDAGRLKVASPLPELRSRWRKYELSSPGHDLDSSLRELGLVDYEKRGEAYTVFVGGDHDRVLASLGALPVTGLRAGEMRLEEIFFSIVGHRHAGEERERHQR